MQRPIIELINLGKFPNSGAPDYNEKVEQIQYLLHAIHTPVTNSEAEALAKLFGQDDFYGLAWTLLHLIETAPNWPLQQCLADVTNPWIALLSKRAGV